VLGEEAQQAAQVLDVQPAPVRGAAHVHDLRVVHEDGLPARPAEPEHPVRLLAEHEEVLVEEPDVLRRRDPHEQRRPLQRLDLPRLVVVEAAAVERVEERRARREPAQEEVLGREPPERREAAHRPLQRAVRVGEPRAGDGDVRVLVEMVREPLDRVADHPRVRVEQEGVAPACDTHAGVVARPHAAVLLLEQPHAREAVAHEPERAVRRAVVDDDHLPARDRVEAALEPGKRVEGDDDDGDVAPPVNHR
jgi:hypothetical protein